MPGTCRILEDCPAALLRWKKEQVLPKTCYFVKYDQYVCCAKDDKNIDPYTTVEPPTLPPLTVERPSVQGKFKFFLFHFPFSFFFCATTIICLPLAACEESKIFGVSVVGGKPTEYGEFPFMAALGWPSHFDGGNFFRCGGTLISPLFVLTAAHCIKFGGQYPTVVRLGGENLTLGMGQEHEVRRVFVHPEYKKDDSYNDIALLELEDSKPSKYQIACLWPHKELQRKDLIAIGYGQIRFAGLPSSQLLKVDLELVHEEQCKPHYTRDLLSAGLAKTQLCAGVQKGVGDTCQGDSGGPLLMKEYATWYAVGITSLGQGCASGPPSVYTRVSAYLDWIESIVWPRPEQVEQYQPTFDLRMSD